MNAIGSILKRHSIPTSVFVKSGPFQTFSIMYCTAVEYDAQFPRSLRVINSMMRNIPHISISILYFSIWYSLSLTILDEIAHEGLIVLVNRLGGLSLPRKSVVRLTDSPDMTLDVYRGRKTTIQQQLIT